VDQAGDSTHRFGNKRFQVGNKRSQVGNRRSQVGNKRSQVGNKIGCRLETKYVAGWKQNRPNPRRK